MGLAGGKGQAQRLARAEQMGLADDLIRGLRAQLFGQRSVAVGGGGRQLIPVLSGIRAENAARQPHSTIFVPSRAEMTRPCLSRQMAPAPCSPTTR